MELKQLFLAPILKKLLYKKYNGVSTNGMINAGFNTIGVPKITGSLMLKKPGPIDTRPTPRSCALFATSITATRNANVAPDPPIYTYTSKKGFVKICGTSYADIPSLNNLIFFLTLVNKLGQ